MLVAFTAGVGAAGLWYGFRWWRWARLIEDTPTSQVRSAAQGLVELVGTARGMPGAPVIAPLSRRQ
jgi:multidrug resistance efflux pump